MAIRCFWKLSRGVTRDRHWVAWLSCWLGRNWFLENSRKISCRWRNFTLKSSTHVAHGERTRFGNQPLKFPFWWLQPVFSLPRSEARNSLFLCLCKAVLLTSRDATVRRKSFVSCVTLSVDLNDKLFGVSSLMGNDMWIIIDRLILWANCILTWQLATDWSPNRHCSWLKSISSWHFCEATLW